MEKKVSKFLLIGMVLLVCACNQTSSKGNSGRVVKRIVQDITLQATFLNGDYGAQEHEEDSDADKHNHHLKFLLSIKPADGYVDLAKYRVTNYEEYATRINTLSFHMEEYFSLQSGEQVIQPTFARYENLNDPEGRVNIVLGFNLEKEKPDQMDLIFKDPFWQTGIHHFVFDKKIWI